MNVACHIWHATKIGTQCVHIACHQNHETSWLRILYIVFCVSAIRHDLSLGKYRKQKQSPPWHWTKTHRRSIRVTAATSSQRAPKRHPPWTSVILNIIRGVNASQKRTSQDHGVSILMMNYGHAKSLKSGFCMTHPVPSILHKNYWDLHIYL
jgi:hypothetical protein